MEVDTESARGHTHTRYALLAGLIPAVLVCGKIARPANLLRFACRSRETRQAHRHRRYSSSRFVGAFRGTSRCTSAPGESVRAGHPHARASVLMASSSRTEDSRRIGL